MTISPSRYDDRAETLLARLTGLRADLLQDAAQILAQWRPALVDAEALLSAENLAHYLALRRTDVSLLQPGLQMLGLSSLGSCEGHALASLDAVLVSLGRIAGRETIPYPPATAFTAGPSLLRERQMRIFGRDPDGPGTRIMVTLPSEAAVDGGLIPELIAKGADCLRINCAHDGDRAWAAMVAIARRAARDQGRDVRVVMDLAGPKIRIREVRAEPDARLFAGDSFLIADTLLAKPHLPQITLSHPELLAQLTPGAVLSIDDGKLAARVVAREDGLVTAEVT